MNKAAMISMQPKQCELIASGKKTIDVRKTRPQIETPFKCYIYETKGLCDTPTFVDEDGHISYRGRGAVIGECVCDKVYDITPVPYYEEETGYKIPQVVLDGSCLFAHDIITYLTRYDCRRNAYGWHISALKIYDKPKELGEFKPYCNPDTCVGCRYFHNGACADTTYCSRRPLARPPQSYVYVEELTDGKDN